MGSSKSRVLQINEIQEEIAKCQLISIKKCKIYGMVNYIKYNGMKLYMGESTISESPANQSLHYLVQPNLLLIPQFTLLQEMKFSHINQALTALLGIVSMGSTSGIGAGYGRIAYAGRWGTVGQKNNNWGYSQVLNSLDYYGVYLSPQQMMALADKQKQSFSNQMKNDVFTIGLMLLQCIFQQKLNIIYDYTKFQIRLKPLICKLNMLRKQYGQQIYQLWVSMLEIDAQNRLSFQEIKKRLKIISSKLKLDCKGYNSSSKTPIGTNKENIQCHSSRNHNHSSSQLKLVKNDIKEEDKDTSANFKTPKKQYKIQPKKQNLISDNYKNNISPFRSRFGIQQVGVKQVQSCLSNQAYKGTYKKLDKGQSNTERCLSKSPIERQNQVNNNCYLVKNTKGNLIGPKEVKILPISQNFSPIAFRKFK